MSQPLVSILVNNYNYGRFLRAAINSALQQTYTNIEVIVVDDGSTDGSRDIIRSFGQRIIPIFKENGGQSSAFNAGFAVSRGFIICFLDSDDLFLPTKVKEVVDAFEHSPIGWCFHKLRLVGYEAEREIESPIVNRRYTCGILDLRTELCRGGSDFLAPATSGIAFSRQLLSRLLPMPNDIRSENYLKFIAMALSPGFYISHCLGLQRIHGANWYTGQDIPVVKADVHIVIAKRLRQQFPQLRRMGDRMFVGALLKKWNAGGKLALISDDLVNYLNCMPLFQRPELLLRLLTRATKAAVRLSRVE